MGQTPHILRLNLSPSETTFNQDPHKDGQEIWKGERRLGVKLFFPSLVLHMKFLVISQYRGICMKHISLMLEDFWNTHRVGERWEEIE